MNSPRLLHLRDAVIALFAADATLTAGVAPASFAHAPVPVKIGLWALAATATVSAVALIGIALANLREACRSDH